MNVFKKFALAAVPACALFVGSLAPTDAQAARIQLGFVLDDSGSITASEWNIIRTGLASAINLIPVGGADLYEVSVVRFSTTAITVASNVVLGTAADRTNLANTIAGMSQAAGFTNFEAGFLAMRDVLNNTVNLADFSYVNFATDGEPNRCGYPTTTTPPNTAAAQACSVSGRDALISAGVDNISIEGIGVSAGNAAWMQSAICHPQPCDTTDPYNFPTQGFYIGVSNATQYAAAIQNKIRVVTGQTPEPGTIALVGLALAGLGLARRRTQAPAA